MTTTPYSSLTDLLSNLIGTVATPDPESSTVEWDPLEAGHVRVRYADEPAPVAPGSIRQYLRDKSTPTLTPIMDMVGNAASTMAVHATANPIGGAVTSALKGAADARNTVTGGGAGKLGKWTATNESWQALDGYERAAAMALMEAEDQDPGNAKNAAAAMVNRARQRKADLGEHVSSRSYQPTFEPAQEKRLKSILSNPVHSELTAWIKRYSEGQEDDPIGGATHFIAHPRVMLALEASNPGKYRSWRGWTQFDPRTAQYANTITSDRSHTFLAPEGRYSVPRLYK